MSSITFGIRIFLHVVQSVSKSFSNRHGLGLSNIVPARKRDGTMKDRLLFTSFSPHNRLASRSATAFPLIVGHIEEVLGTAVNFSVLKDVYMVES